MTGGTHPFRPERVASQQKEHRPWGHEAEDWASYVSLLAATGAWGLVHSLALPMVTVGTIPYFCSRKPTLTRHLHVKSSDMGQKHPQAIYSAQVDKGSEDRLKGKGPDSWPSSRMPGWHTSEQPSREG